MAKGIKYTQADIDSLIVKIYEGDITAEELPIDLYTAIADGLKKKLYDGYGAKLAELEEGTPEFELLASLRDNVYMFSGAKTFQVVNELEALANQSLTVEQYQEQARGIVALYTDTWQETEENTSEAMAQAADKWNEIEQNKDALPYLRFNALSDANVDEECLAMDGITLPVDDPLWDTHSPPLHWNCRCLLEQLDAEPSTEKEVTEARETVDDHISDLFLMNPGKTGLVFPEDHPYFNVPKQYEKLAQENFNLPIPEKDGTAG